MSGKSTNAITFPRDRLRTGSALASFGATGACSVCSTRATGAGVGVGAAIGAGEGAAICGGGAICGMKAGVDGTGSGQAASTSREDSRSRNGFAASSGGGVTFAVGTGGGGFTPPGVPGRGGTAGFFGLPSPSDMAYSFLRTRPSSVA
jgi:hypothetical protein